MSLHCLAGVLFHYSGSDTTKKTSVTRNKNHRGAGIADPQLHRSRSSIRLVVAYLRDTEADMNVSNLNLELELRFMVMGHAEAWHGDDAVWYLGVQAAVDISMW